MNVFFSFTAMSPALGMHPGMAPHLQQLQAHLLRSAAAAALLPHAHPLQPPPPPPHPHSHPHSHGLAPHTQLFSVPPHSAASVTLGPHGGGLPPKTEVIIIFVMRRLFIHRLVRIPFISVNPCGIHPKQNIQEELNKWEFNCHAVEKMLENLPSFPPFCWFIPQRR